MPFFYQALQYQLSDGVAFNTHRIVGLIDYDKGYFYPLIIFHIFKSFSTDSLD